MKDKYIKKAYEALAELVKKSKSNMSNSSFAGIYDKKTPNYFIGYGCHYNLRSLGKNTVAIVSRICPNSSNSKDKATEIYYNWLFNDSPWADMFVIKDAKEAIKLKGVICETNYPSNYIAGGIFATRAPWQAYFSVKALASLLSVNKKLNKNLAFIGSLWVGTTNVRSKKYFTLVSRSWSGNSAIINQFQSLSFVKNFINGKMIKPRADFCDNPLYKKRDSNDVYHTWSSKRVASKEFYNLLEKNFKNREYVFSIRDAFNGETYKYIGHKKEKEFFSHLADSLIKIQKGKALGL